MSLATRCPECKTLFKVTAVQLQQHNGQVQCGFCSAVFSGVEQLTPADADTWSANTEAAHALPVDASPDTEPDRAAEPLTDSLLAMLPRSKAPRQPWPRKARWACIGLSVLLGWQLIWWQRNAIAHALPVVDGPLMAIASVLGTQVSSPASKNITIVGSSLNSSKDEQLRADIRLAHRGTTPSQWPVIRVELLDSQQSSMGHILLRPTDYTIKPELYTRIGPRILPGQEFDVTAYLNIQALNARFPDSRPTGFRLSVFDQHP